MKYKIVKSYCGLIMIYNNEQGIYMNVDRYTGLVKKAGTFALCERHYNSYVQKIIERD